jgi:hypothetical protein
MKIPYQWTVSGPNSKAILCTGEKVESLAAKSKVRVHGVASEFKERGWVEDRPQHLSRRCGWRFACSRAPGIVKVSPGKKLL